MDTCYSCHSKEVVEVDPVNMTLWNVLIQAFVSNGSKSENSKFRCRNASQTGRRVFLSFVLMLRSLSSPQTVTACAADTPSTPVPPTTPATSTTTAAPTTTPTTTPTPSLPTPPTGKYSIKPDQNSTACLLANFGLRVGFKQGDVCASMHIDKALCFTGSMLMTL